MSYAIRKIEVGVVPKPCTAGGSEHRMDIPPLGVVVTERFCNRCGMRFVRDEAWPRNGGWRPDHSDPIPENE